MTWVLVAFVGSVGALGMFLSILALDECWTIRRAVRQMAVDNGFPDPFNGVDYDGEDAP